MLCLVDSLMKLLLILEWCSSRYRPNKTTVVRFYVECGCIGSVNPVSRLGIATTVGDVRR